MKASINFLISMLLLLVSSQTVLAARYGLLFFRPEQQWVEFTYGLDNYQFQNSTSQLQHLTESYNFLFDYALINTHILNGKAALKLLADQQNASGGVTSGVSS